MTRTSAVLHQHTIHTPLGEMTALTDDNFLYLLEFVNYKKLDKEINRIIVALNASIQKNKETKVARILNLELNQYFDSKLSKFTVPIKLIGTEFQKKVWHKLCDIPYGVTKSYQDIANLIQQPTAFRAVANANGANKLAIIIPCHRVINTNGQLGGYAGGVNRKQWLLSHECNRIL